MGSDDKMTAKEFLAYAKKNPGLGRGKAGGDKQKAEIEMVLKLLGVEYKAEVCFHPTRKWRFDFAIVEHKIGIEYEGINSEKSRHTTITGYTEDANKYNEAQKLGWKVLRYTAINYKNITEDLKQIIN